VDGDRALLGALFEAFQQDYPKQLVELWDAISTGDAAYTARVAHSLKGAIGYFGAQRASALAAQLETLGRQAAMEDAASILQQLEQECGRMSAFVAESGWVERV
jgi:HPt (histidine-containing phosphotransfer) domain-containing protein